MSITSDLSAKVESELVEATQEDGLMLNEVIAQASNDYLFIRKFRRVRAKMQAQAERVYTDAEIFEIVSWELSLRPMF